MDFNPDWFVDRLEQFQSFREMLERDRPQTMMLIEAGEKKGKSWLLRHLEQHCLDASPPVATAFIDFRDPRINNVDDLRMMLLLRDSVAAPVSFAPLNQEIGRHVSDPVQVFARPMQLLADEINDVFLNEGDLIIFARYINVNYDDLPGDMKREKVFQLVNYCREQNVMAELREELIREREHKMDVWTRLIEDIIQAEQSNASPAAVDSNVRLQAHGTERERIIQAVTKVFVDCLIDYLAAQSRFVLLIDSYEDCPHDAQRWLEQDFLPYLPEEAIKEKLILVLAGRETMYVRLPAVKELIVRDEQHEQNPLKHGLLPFSKEFIAEYSKKRQVNEEWAMPANLEQAAGGDPYFLAMVYEMRLARR